ncbi:thiamine biosynthesis lipoprotein [Rhodoblastus acidophilus]|nr:FAD:protein FMN transferase [Rhodoblastus acidophilus]MCW2273654.1 thiamine biosynthesis lipoprotein [Rhodoblastus acidophilus]
MSFETLRRRALNGPAMGARWSAVFHAPENFDDGALALALQEALEAVELQMSAWRPESDIERFNRAPPGVWRALPQNLLTVLEAAMEIGALSGGAFDIGVGDLVNAWGLGAGSRTPDSTMPVGYTAPTLQIDMRGLRARKFSRQRLDLSGIAKGFGVDELARVMRAFGLSSWLVGIDGEMRACGHKADGRPWAVGHERPGRDARELMGVIALQDCAVATSGNYRHVVEVEGHTLSHTIDPRRGAPLVNDLACVSVLAPSAMVADAWATALMVLGAEQGVRLARRLGLEAILVANAGDLVMSRDDARAGA